MRRLAWAAVACLVLCGLIPSVASAQSGTAAGDIVIDINANAPLFGSALAGAFTMSPAGTGATMAGPWSFTGTVAGQPASASGQGRGTVKDAQTITFELTSIDQWAMGPLPRPAVPASITLHSNGSNVALTWDRLGLTGNFAISPALSLPASAGGAHYSLSSSGTGQTSVQSLPQTGSGAALAASGWPPAALVSLMLAALCAAAGWWLRRSPDVRGSGIRGV